MNPNLFILRWFCQKKVLSNRVNAIILELSFCSAHGTCTPAQVIRARKRLKATQRHFHFKRKVYNFTSKSSLLLNN